MNDLTLGFEPHLPVAILLALAAGSVLVAAVALWRNARGALARLGLFALFLLVLANPVLVAEERQSLDDVAVVVVDRSTSQSIGQRTGETDAAVAALRARLARLDGLDVRVVEARTALGRDAGTELFKALGEAVSDVPPDRVAGSIFVTDGEVHDVPATPPITAPIHTLLTGQPNEKDRKLSLDEAPRFGIVGETTTLTVRVEDFGHEGAPAPARVTIRMDGANEFAMTAQPGVPLRIPLRLEHGGENVVELEVERGPAELTLLNNRAVAVINGVRDRLRVLLISGEPHPGERTWRNLLKADPSVDLVHFTILRPPEKQDDTPIDELSLIAFPTRELFVEKLHEFDLIIFDRYRRRAVLPTAYYSNIVDYLRDGGAILVASGPDFASPLSIYRTALSSVLPGRPTGAMIEQGYKPHVTEIGARHPVTADLPGMNPGGEPRWGRWFRLVETARVAGTELMTGPQDKPLLVLDRVENGRIALLLSDHAWLWTRGVEGGGPQGELLRRLAHWLMKEPDLEEERLSGRVEGGTLTLTRRTMAEKAEPTEVTLPNGEKTSVTMAPTEPGRFEGSLAIEDPGLYRLRNGDLVAVAAAGALNAREFADVRATDAIMLPVANVTGGQVLWLKDEPDPAIRLESEGSVMGGGTWLGLRANGAYVVTAIEEVPLIAPALALLLLLGALLFTWRLEGR